MEPWKRLLLKNKAWAQDKAAHTGEAAPGTERPEFLWIGSSDAGMPADDLTGTTGTDLVVHRNLGNLVVHTDPNMMAVLESAIEQGVGHVIVCGHYGCLAVRATLERQTHGMMDAWLNHIKDVWRAHKDELALHDDELRHRRLVELNVMQQVRNLARTSVIQRVWAAEQRPTLHGWVYNPHDHLIRPLVRVDADTPLDEVHRLVDVARPEDPRAN